MNSLPCTFERRRVCALNVESFVLSVKSASETLRGVVRRVHALCKRHQALDALSPFASSFIVQNVRDVSFIELLTRRTRPNSHARDADWPGSIADGEQNVFVHGFLVVANFAVPNDAREMLAQRLFK